MINESQELIIYKKVLNIFADFIDKQPATGLGKMYKQLLDLVLKCVPRDKRALEILDSILTVNAPKSIQTLLNISFIDLPITVRPMYLSGNTREVAFWKRGNNVYTKVCDLLNLSKDEGEGYWVNKDGNRVTLVK